MSKQEQTPTLIVTPGSKLEAKLLRLKQLHQQVLNRTAQPKR